MVYIYKKSIGDKSYYYLRASKRKGSRVLSKDIAYLGSSIAEVQRALSKLPEHQIREAYKTLNRFVGRNKWLEKSQNAKLKDSPFISKELLEEVEACRLHWNEEFCQRHELTKEDRIKIFSIEFAFNTTSMEGNTISLEQTGLLLTEELTPANKTLREIFDVQNTQQVLMKITKEPPKITNDSLISIHKSLMENVDSRIGFRNSDVHVIGSGFESTPAQYIKTDIDLLIRWLEQNKKSMHPIALAAIFHHKFERVHPFFDGNGRVGRMALNAILIKEGYPPMIIRKKRRKEYLLALKSADKAGLTEASPTDYRRLVSFIAEEMADTYWNTFL